MRNHKQSWLDLFMGFRVALDLKKMVLGMFGAYATVAILLGMGRIAARFWPDMLSGLQGFSDNPCGALSQVACAVVAQVRVSVAHPLGSGAGVLAFLAGGGILLLALWAFIGGAIARIAAVDVAQGERPSVGRAAYFACRKFGSFFWSPVVPSVFILLFLSCNALLGLIGRIPGIGPIVVGALFFLAMISSFIILLLAIGGYLGAIFMWPTIAMEGTDAFDAISRSFNYLFARPWKTFWCWLVMSAYGCVVIAFVAVFAALLLKIATASVTVGLGENASEITRYLWTAGLSGEVGISSMVAIFLIRTFTIMVCGLVLGFVASFKISAMTIIYAVLRRDVDGTDMSEVFLPVHNEEPASEPATQS